MQCLTFKKQADNNNCPVKRLQDFCAFNGNPSQGEIFPNTSAASVLRITQITAEKLNLTRPTGHTGRVSMATTLQGAQVPTETIMSFMNWKTPRMPNAYANIRAQRMSNAPASLITDREKILEIQSQLF